MCLVGKLDETSIQIVAVFFFFWRLYWFESEWLLWNVVENFAEAVALASMYVAENGKTTHNIY